jgi:hypothetical protein
MREMTRASSEGWVIALPMLGPALSPIGGELLISRRGPSIHHEISTPNALHLEAVLKLWGG